jgi:hypothetical protein
MNAWHIIVLKLERIVTMLFLFKILLFLVFEIFPLIHLDYSLIYNYVRLIQSMVSTICLLFLFVASITGENAFVRLHLIHVLLGAFVLIIGVVQGGAT